MKQTVNSPKLNKNEITDYPHLFLDIELCDNIPDGWDRDDPSSLDIACICVLIIDDKQQENTIVHHNEGKAMTHEQIQVICDQVKNVCSQNGKFITWNGLGFDMQLLDKIDNTLKQLILSDHHIDLMFHFTRKKGYMIGLNKVSQGFSIGEKTMTGLDAVKLWAKGEFQKVLDYNINDVKLLKDIYYKVIETSKIKWLSGNHNICFLNVDTSQLSVGNSLNIPRPPNKDVSWMTQEHKKLCEWAWRVKPIK